MHQLLFCDDFLCLSDFSFPFLLNFIREVMIIIVAGWNLILILFVANNRHDSKTCDEQYRDS